MTVNIFIMNMLNYIVFQFSETVSDRQTCQLRDNLTKFEVKDLCTKIGVKVHQYPFGAGILHLNFSTLCM